MTVSLIQRICSSGHQVGGHYCDEKKKLIAAGRRVRGSCVRRAGSRKRGGRDQAAGGFDGMEAGDGSGGYWRRRRGGHGCGGWKGWGRGEKCRRRSWCKKKL